MKPAPDIESISCEQNVSSLSMNERIRATGENSSFGDEICENSWHYKRSGVNSNGPEIDIVPSYNTGTRNEGSGENSNLC